MRYVNHTKQRDLCRRSPGVRTAARVSGRRRRGLAGLERATDADLALGLSNRGAHRFGEMAGFALGVFCGITEGARGGVG